MFERNNSQAGFTLVELFVVIAVIGILLGMLMPSMRYSGEAARRTTCANQVRQVALATHNYHSANGHFPMAMGSIDTGLSHPGAERISGLVSLLAFLEESELWSTVSNASVIEGQSFPPTPAPWADYQPWKRNLGVFMCPSSGYSKDDLFGRTDYAFCIGDQARNIHSPTVARGAFACNRKTTLEQMFDGTSNTIALGEIGSFDREKYPAFVAISDVGILEQPALVKELMYDSDGSDAIKVSLMRRGGCWADGSAGPGIFNTILPPGQPSAATSDLAAVDGIFTAGRLHPSGINVAFADGSAHFITSTIDSGEPTIPAPTVKQMEAGQFASPYGVWGALGTATGNEDLSDGWYVDFLGVNFDCCFVIGANIKSAEHLMVNCEACYVSTRNFAEDGVGWCDRWLAFHQFGSVACY